MLLAPELGEWPTVDAFSDVARKACKSVRANRMRAYAAVSGRPTNENLSCGNDTDY
jgi:hypothetical protein